MRVDILLINIVARKTKSYMPTAFSSFLEVRFSRAFFLISFAFSTSVDFSFLSLLHFFVLLFPIHLHLWAVVFFRHYIENMYATCSSWDMDNPLWLIGSRWRQSNLINTFLFLYIRHTCYLGRWYHQTSIVLNKWGVFSMETGVIMGHELGCADAIVWLSLSSSSLGTNLGIGQPYIII